MNYKNLDKEQFRELYPKHTLLELSKKYEVSSSAISLWGRNLGLLRKNSKFLDHIEEPNDIQKQIIIGSMLGTGPYLK